MNSLLCGSIVSCEYPDENLVFDSYMIEEKDLKADQPRLLAVDNEVVVLSLIHI